MIELNPKYAGMARRRIVDALPLMVTVTEDALKSTAQTAEVAR